MTSFFKYLRVAAAKRPGTGRELSIGSPGITLLELLVVLAIIAMIGFVAIPLYLDKFSQAQSQTASIQIKQLGTILDMYRLDVGGYPATADGLEALLTQPSGVDRWTGPYLKDRESLTDPWGQPYGYRSPGDNGQYDLWSLGADGADGGEGNDADITSW